MSDHDDNHGSSPAAWALVGIFLLGAVIVAVGFLVQNWAVVATGVVVALLGLVVGKVMQSKGLGSRPAEPRRPVTLD